jgi:hypothetical protein
MTTVVATRAALYADSACVSDILHSTRKLFKVEPKSGVRYLVGVAGDLDVVLRMVAVLRKNTLDTCSLHPIPDIDKDDKDDHEVVVVTEDRQIFRLGARMVPVEVTEDNFISIGSGAPYALSALDFGKTPRQAIEYAATRDENTRAPVKVLTFRTKE